MNLQELPASGDSVTAANENSLLLDWSTVYGKNPATTSGLTWGYHGTPSDGAQEGRWGGFEVAAGTFTLTDDAVNYIVAKRSDGVTTASTSDTNWNNTAEYARVYKVTTADGLVTEIEDHRAGPKGVLSGADGTGLITVVDGTGSPGISLTSIDTLEFMGGAAVHNMGGGRALVNVTAAGGGGIDSGTSNPGGPSTGDLFWRTDLNLLIFYDGTRWLTVQQYVMPLLPTNGVTDNISATKTGAFRSNLFFLPTYDVWLETLYASMFVVTTNNGTNFWTFSLNKQDSGGSNTQIAAPTTAANSANTWVNSATAIGALAGAFTTLSVNLNKTLSPGNLFAHGFVTGRLVIT